MDGIARKFLLQRKGEVSFSAGNQDVECGIFGHAEMLRIIFDRGKSLPARVGRVPRAPGQQSSRATQNYEASSIW
jgi:hypothetical protein